MEAKVFKFFELYGVHYEIYTQKFSMKLQNCVIIFWLFSYGFHFCASTLRLLGMTQNYFEERDYTIQFALCVTTQVFGFVILTRTMRYREKDLKILQSLRDVDELLKKFLKMKLRNSFDSLAFYKVAIQSSILFGLIIFRLVNQDEIYKYKTSELPVPDVAIMTAGMYVIKYIFYADLMNMKLELLKKNFHKITSNGVNIFILQRIHAKIWNTSHQINKYCGINICICILMIIIGTLDHGLILAGKLAGGLGHWTALPISLMPIYNFFMLGYACTKSGEISKELRTILVKNANKYEVRRTKLVSHYSMQVDMQDIKFEPGNLLMFDIVFIMETVRVIIDYDIVFMQFYFT